MLARLCETGRSWSGGMMKALAIATAMAAVIAVAGCGSAAGLQEPALPEPPTVDEQFQALIDMSRPFGSSYDEQKATDWFQSVYGGPECADPTDTTQDCSITTLLETRQVDLQPGDYTEVPLLEADGGFDRYDITRPSRVWCFKTQNFDRLVYDDSDYRDRTYYEFACYLLDGADDDGGRPMAIYMGTLLPDGRIGISPKQECTVKYGFGVDAGTDNLLASNKCHDENEWKVEPSW